MLGSKVGNFAEMHLTATKWQGGCMSKLSRVAEFAAASWVLVGAILGGWSLREFLTVAPLPFTATYILTQAIIGFGCVWHMLRALRGR